MCGSSNQQNQIESSTQSFASTLNANYAANYGAQSAILKNLGNILTPIAEAGPSQQGWSLQQQAAVNTQIGEGTAANYSKAAQVLNDNLSAQGGGNEVLPSGASAALKGQLASAAANTLSGEQLAATEANYAQGNQNWMNATSGLNALSQDYNPNAVAGAATSSASSAYGEAQQNAMQGYQQFGDIASGISSLASAGLAGAKTGAGISSFAGGGAFSV